MCGARQGQTGAGFPGEATATLPVWDYTLRPRHAERGAFELRRDPDTTPRPPFYLTHTAVSAHPDTHNEPKSTPGSLAPL